MKQKIVDTARRVTGGAAEGWLGEGSEAVWQRLADRVTTWVRAGRRDDLSGWQAALGPLVRLALVVALGYGVWVVVRRWPWLLWLLGAAWRRAAWKAGGNAPAAAADEAAETSEEAHRAALIRWLDEVTLGRNGIHLEELHKRLTQRPALAHLKQADVTALLSGYRIAVDRALRVDGIAGRSGVSRKTVEALIEGLDASLSPVDYPPDSPSTESGPDLRESPDSPGTLHHSPAA